MANNPVAGVGYVVQGLRLLTRPGLKRFVALPLLLNILLFGGLIWYGGHWFDLFMDRMLPQSWDALRWLLWPIFAVSALVMGFFTFTLLANLISAPFNGLLAEKVEKHLTGKRPHSDLGLLASIVPSILHELHKIGYFALLAVPVLLLFLVPVVQLAAPFVWLAYSAWVLAVEYADYPMANHLLRFRQQRERLRDKPLTAFGFGAGVLFMTMVPVLNFLAMPTGVAGATAMWVGEWRGGEDWKSGTSAKQLGQ